MKRLLVGSLLGVMLLLALAAGGLTLLAATRVGSAWVLAQAGAALEWRSFDGTLLRGLQLDGVRFVQGQTSVTADSVRVAWQPWRLLDGALVFDEVQARNLVLQLPAGGGEPLTAANLQAALFGLPVAIKLRGVDIASLTLVRPGGPVTLDRLSGAASLDAELLALEGVTLVQGATTLSGSVALTRELGLSGSIVWQAAVAGRPVDGALELSGTLSSLQLEHRLASPWALLSSGTLRPGLFAGENAGFDLQHEAQPQTLTTFALPDISVGGSLTTRGRFDDVEINGNLTVNALGLQGNTLNLALRYADGVLAIESLRLDNRELRVEASGRVVLVPVEAQVQWSLTRLDLATRLPALELGAVTGNGTLSLALQGGQPSGMLTVEAITGTLHGFPLQLTGQASFAGPTVSALDLQLDSGGNAVDVRGSIGEQWDLQWELEAPTLQTLAASLAGALTGKGHIGGTPALPEFDGTLHASALRYGTGAAALSLTDAELTASHGEAGNDLSLVLSDIGRGGAVLLQNAALNLTGTPAQHSVRATLEAPGAVLQVSATGELTPDLWRGRLREALLDGDYGRWQLMAPAALEYRAGKATLAQHCWSQGSTSVCGSAARQAAGQLDADLELNGLPLAWLNSGPQAPGSTPPALRRWQEALALSLPAGTTVDGVLDGSLSGKGLQSLRTAELEARLAPRGLALQITRQTEQADEAPSVQRFAFEVGEAQLQQVRGAWNLGLGVGITREEDGGPAERSSLQGRLSLGADEALSGAMTLRVDGMGWLAALVPELSAPAGTLEASLALAGTRAQPQARLTAALREGSVDLPAYGLQLRDAEATLETGPGGSWQWSGSASAGGGELTLAGRVDDPLQATRNVEVQVRGAGIRALDTTAFSATLSPDLSLRYGSSGVAINGTLTLSEAEVALERLFGAGASSAVTPSGDVRIVRGQAAQVNEERQRVPLTLNLRVVAGDKLHVQGYDLEAQLTGALDLQQTPGRALLIYGQLDVPKGSYDIYNQHLSIENGSLTFFGNPTNPSIDLRAFRATTSAEVGVQLTGNVKNIRGELYSTPVLPANEALALLVTGKSISDVNAQENSALLGAIANLGLGRGQGLTQGITERVSSTLGLDDLSVGGGTGLEDSALGLGKYLSPDLLLRYKVGLFDRQSVLGIEYTLSEKIKLKVESGISQSVELSYMIERD